MRVQVAVKARNLRVGDWLTIYGQGDIAPKVVKIESITPPDPGYKSFGVELEGRMESFAFKPNQRVVVFR